VVTGFVVASGAAGGAGGVAPAFGSPAAPGLGGVPALFGWLPSAGVLPLAAPPVVAPPVPGVTTSTTAPVPAPVLPPSCERLPGVKISVADVVSASGVRFGSPVRAAATYSACGAV